MSSLGDVIHTLPAAWDIRQTQPQAQIDWVVEPAFAEVLKLSVAVDRIIECPLRSWRKSRFDSWARHSMREFWSQLRMHSYDWVIDLQGLTKSGVISRLARVHQGGSRVAMANATLGSSYERPTAWLSDVLIDLPQDLGAIDRSRHVCAKALGYPCNMPMQFGLQSLYSISTTPHSNSKERVVLITGTSRLDKAWPIDNWIELARRLHSNALEVCLVHGNDTEEAFAKQVQLEVPDVVIWPRLELSALALQMKECIGSIGVDSGPSHLSVALGMTHVQIYNFPTAWRTGPSNSSHQISVYHKPTPSVQEVWDGWQRVQSSPRHFESTFEH